MKKRNLLIVALLFSVLSLNAQTFKSGDLVGNLTIGFGNALYSAIGFSTTVPPIAISGDYGIVDNVLEKGSIGIGGYIGYAASSWSYSILGSGASWTYTNIIIGPRGTFHYPFVDKLDTYAGLLIGYNIATISASSNLGGYSYTTPAAGGLITSGFIGGRYYFTDKIAGVCEIGWGIAYFNIGVSLKLK